MTTLKKMYDDLVLRDDDMGHQHDFSQMRPDVKIAIYQKLLFKSGEGDAKASAILDNLKSEISKLPPEIQAGIKNEHQRYQVAKANAVYQDFLQREVLSRAKDIPAGKLMFDPQGRLIHELKLSDEDRKTVLESIEKSLGMVSPAGRNPQTVKDDLKKLLGGRTPTDTTLCSIDLSEPTSVGQAPNLKNEENRKILLTKFSDIYKPVKNPKITDRIELIKIPNDKRSSIIASFEENYAHLSLMAKSYENLSRKAGFDKAPQLISSDQWQAIRQKAALTLQAAVATAFKDALKKATSADGTVDIIKLNEAMAKERKSLADIAKTELLTEVVNHLKTNAAQKPDAEQRSAVLNYMQNLSKNLDKHTFTETTATGHDYFHTSNYLQQGMLISGTKDTAHNKPKFKQRELNKDQEDQAAYRRVTYTYRDDNGNLQATSAVSARIPSPALVFDKNMKPSDIKADLVRKYAFMHEQMRHMRGDKPGPVVENLFTSFHTTAFDQLPGVGDANNLQRKSADFMIQAMHVFNATQLNSTLKNRADNNFLYIQNIGTNRNTYDLGYRGERGINFLTGSVELDDITLSAEMAMLHTLKENSAYFSAELKDKINLMNNSVLYNYSQFLSMGANRPTYFADSKYGQRVIKEITQFKNELPGLINKQEDNPNDLNALASNALLRMVSKDQHWDSRYGQLAQVLSMYNQWASTGGCKSGNERNQDVMLRFALLKSIHERVGHTGDMSKLQDHEKAIYKELQAYSKGETSNPDALRAAIAISVKECNLQGGVAAISREDQGGAAKVASRSKIHDMVNDIKFPPGARMLVQFVAGVLGAVALVLGAITYPIRPLSKALFQGSSALFSSFDTNNAADSEMQLTATGASKTQAHKDQDELTAKAVLDVLDRDKLFKDKPLNADEKDGFKFKKDKNAHAKEHGAQQPDAPVVGGVQVAPAVGADGADPTIARVPSDGRSAGLREPLLAQRRDSVAMMNKLMPGSGSNQNDAWNDDDAYVPPPPPGAPDNEAGVSITPTAQSITIEPKAAGSTAGAAQAVAPTAASAEDNSASPRIR